MKELVEYIVKTLVDKPEEVDVKEVSGKTVTIYELKVGAGDIGKIIGKQGQTARSIRTILNACASREHKRAVLEILE